MDNVYSPDTRFGWALALGAALVSVTLWGCAQGGGGTGSSGGEGTGGSAQVIINVFGKAEVPRHEYVQKAKDLGIPPVILNKFLRILSTNPIPSSLTKETLEDMSAAFDGLHVQLLMDKFPNRQLGIDANDALELGDFDKVDSILKKVAPALLWRLKVTQADYRKGAELFKGQDQEVFFKRISWNLAKLFYSQDRATFAFCAYSLYPQQGKVPSASKELKNEIERITKESVLDFIYKYTTSTEKCRKQLGFGSYSFVWAHDLPTLMGADLL